MNILKRFNEIVTKFFTFKNNSSKIESNEYIYIVKF